MAKTYLAAFHIVYVTLVFLFVCTCIVENKIFFFFSSRLNGVING